MQRVGLILPSVNVLMEPEFNKLRLEGINFYATRVLLTETTPEALIAMEKDLDKAIELIASVKPDAVAYACTSGSFIGGMDWDKSIAQRIQAEIGCPAITTSAAMIEALKAVKVKRLAVLTPYIDRINEKEKQFFEDNGFEVVAIEGMQITDAEILHSKTPEEIYRWALELDRDDADGLFISCTDFRGMEVIQKLEDKLGKPVVTSNQATLWWLLNVLQYGKNLDGYGLLLQQR